MHNLTKSRHFKFDAEAAKSIAFAGLEAQFLLIPHLLTPSSKLAVTCNPLPNTISSTSLRQSHRRRSFLHRIRRRH